jgi:hypothetical protein
MNQNVRRANTKVCSVCSREKVVGAKNWYKNSTCAACYQKRYKKNFPDKSRDSKLKCYYGISLEQFNSLLKKQDFKCAICKIPDNKLKNGKIQNFVVDHCHTTQKVRGLLCHTCNMRVGIVENWGALIADYLSVRSKG